MIRNGLRVLESQDLQHGETEAAAETEWWDPASAASMIVWDGVYEDDAQ